MDAIERRNHNIEFFTKGLQLKGLSAEAAREKAISFAMRMEESDAWSANQHRYDILAAGMSGDASGIVQGYAAIGGLHFENMTASIEVALKYANDESLPASARAKAMARAQDVAKTVAERLEVTPEQLFAQDKDGRTVLRELSTRKTFILDGQNEEQHIVELFLSTRNGARWTYGHQSPDKVDLHA